MRFVAAESTRTARMSAELEDRVAHAPTARDAVAHTTVEPLLDAKGAAALLNVPATWVLAEARADRIPHVRLGRYVRFDAAELHVWWQSRRRGPWRSRGTAAETARSNSRSATSGRRAA
jgi:excisionase family DNA binding protein